MCWPFTWQKWQEAWEHTYLFSQYNTTEKHMLMAKGPFNIIFLYP